MLTKIVLENFMSFKNETTIDITATSYMGLSKTNVSNNILKGLLFVGANASGKTNIMKSIYLLLSLLLKNDDFNIQSYFCLFSSSKTMKLQFSFKINNNNIIYGFTYNKQGLFETEYLYLNNKELFNRIGLEAKSNITAQKIYNKNEIYPNSLFIRNIYFNTRFKGHKTLELWFDFLKSSVYLSVAKGIILGFNKNINLSLETYIEQYGIDDLNYFLKHFCFKLELCCKKNHYLPKSIFTKTINQKEIFLKKNNINFLFPYSLESQGIKTLLNMLPAIIYVSKANSLLIINEFRKDFHNELEELIIKFFMGNSKQSQIFFSSHSTNIVNASLLRPDQIYSVNFDNENGSYVKRFSSENPSESQNLERMYISGIFKGLPSYKTLIK